MKESGEETIVEFWTLTSRQKLNTSPRELFSSKMESLLTLNVLSILFWMKSSEFMDWKIGSNRSARKITKLETNWTFHLRIHDDSNVLK